MYVERIKVMKKDNELKNLKKKEQKVKENAQTQLKEMRNKILQIIL